MNRRATMAALVIATLALTGCSLIDEVGKVGGSAVEEAALDAELESLRTRIIDLDGITDVVTKAEINGDYGFRVEVTATADAISESVATEIAVAVNDYFAAGALARNDPMFYLNVGDDGGIAVGPLGVGEEQLAAEVAYLYALQEAYAAPMAMTLFVDSPRGPYTRSITSATPPKKVDWDALRAVTDTSSAPRNWQVSGVDIIGTLPPANVTTVVDRLTEALSGNPSDTPAFAWSGPDESLSVSVYSSRLAAHIPLVESSSWPAVKAAVGLLVGARLPAASLTYYGDSGGPQYTLHLGICSGEIIEGVLDAEFVGALEDARVLEGVRVGPGVCIAN